MLIKNFVCLPVRDPASPPQQPAILTVAGLAARRTDSFRVRSGICRADQTVGNRHGDTGHCSRGPKARNRFAPYSKGNSPIRGKADLKIFVCPPRNETSPLEERISIYLFGRSRVGAAIPKVVTVSRIGGQTLSEYAAVSFPESRRNVKGDSVHARGCRARHRHRCVLQKNFSQTTGMNPPKNIQSII